MRNLLTVSCTVAFGALVLTSGAAGAPSKETFGLKGEVYRTGFKIEMKNAANRKLTTVKAGSYRIKIEDAAAIHNFRLRGPGLNQATSVPRTTEAIWAVTLKRGTYTFLCDPHASAMRGTFRVT